MAAQLGVDYLSNARIGEKGQFTIPKQYRDELGLGVDSPMTVVRVGRGLMLIPDQERLQRLCGSIAAAFESRGITAESLLETLPAARERVFARRYPDLASKSAQPAPRRRKAA